MKLDDSKVELAASLKQKHEKKLKDRQAKLALISTMLELDIAKWTDEHFNLALEIEHGRFDVPNRDTLFKEKFSGNWNPSALINNPAPDPVIIYVPEGGLSK